MAVSSTSVKGFKLRQSLYGVDQPAGLPFIIANSQTITLGDAVRLNSSGFLQVCSNGEPILGIVVGLVTKDGMNIFSPRVADADKAGATLTPDDTVAVASTNQSDATKYIKALVVLDPAGSQLWYNDADGDLAQTNVGQLFDTTSSGDQISQSSASDTSGGFQLVALDPDNDSDASKGLFRIVENQLPHQLGNSTAVIS